MKRILFLLILVFPVLLFSQKCDFRENYSNANGWSFEDLNQSGATQTTQRIAINGGTLNYNNSPDGLNITRAYKNIGSNLCDSWVADFVFTPTQVSSNPRSAGHIIFAATAGNQAPLRVPTYVGQAMNFTDQDAIGVFFRSNPNRWNLEIIPFLKDDAQWLPTTNCNPITLDGPQTINTTYQIRLERVDINNGRLTVRRQSTGALVGQCCFPIPRTVQQLNFVQHANATGGDLDREISGNVDNLCIRNCFVLDNCCNPKQIIGDNLICPANEIPRTYSVLADPSATYNWVVPAGITFTGQGTNSITVTNWGNVTGNIQIGVSIECACQTDMLSMNVTIKEDLSPYTAFNYSATTSGNIITNLTFTSSSSLPAGAVHWWNIYEASNCNPTDFSILNDNIGGAVELRNTSFSSTFNVVSPTAPFPNIETGKCYIVKHGLYYENELCPWVEKRGKILISSTARSKKPEVKMVFED